MGGLKTAYMTNTAPRAVLFGQMIGSYVELSLQPFSTNFTRPLERYPAKISLYRCAPIPCGFSLHSPGRTTFWGHELCLDSFHAWCSFQHAQNSGSQTLVARIYSLWCSNGDREVMNTSCGSLSYHRCKPLDRIDQGMYVVPAITLPRALVP
jgi:hypothetical protein